MVANGLDLPEKWIPLLRDRRVGLLTSVSGVNRVLQRNIDCLLGAGIRITALFSPEHGLRGAYAAGDDVASASDPSTGLPVYSLYSKDSRRFSENMVSDVDVIVYDIGDVGARYYTYLTTLYNTVEDCAHFNKPLVVLDRINPLGGNVLEGITLQPECLSFVGAYAMPVRYGMTPGEFANMVNQEQHLGCKLTVVETEGWRRSMLFPDTGLPWIPPSPALQHFENALCYPGTCLLEGTNLSEGRGTADPFIMIGAPYVQAERLVAALNRYGLAGVRFLPVAFIPTASKHQGAVCEGVKLILDDPLIFQPFATALILIQTVQRLWPKDFSFLPSCAGAQWPQIDLLSGSHGLREGHPSLLQDAQIDCEAFQLRRQPYLLYGGA